MGNSVTTESDAVNYSWGMGITDGTNERALAQRIDDGTTITDRLQDEAACYVLLGDGASVATKLNITITSFNGDGWVQNIGTNSSSLAYLVRYIAIGGTTNLVVGQSLVSASPVTGLGFQPNLLFAMTSGQTAGSQNSIFSLSSFGWAERFSASTRQWWNGNFTGEDDATDVNGSIFDDGFVGQVFNNVRTWTMSLTTFDTGGFTWAGSDGDVFYYMAIELPTGIEAFATTFQKSVTTPNVVQALPDSTFTPQAYMLATANYTIKNEDPTLDRNIARSVGGCSDPTFQALTQFSVNLTRENAGNQCDQFSNDQTVLYALGIAVAKNAIGVAQEITDSTPDVDWTTNDNNAAWIGYLAFEEDPVTQLVRLAPETLSIAEQVNQLTEEPALVEFANENLSIAEALVDPPPFGLNRFGNESESISDDPLALRELIRFANETVSLVEGKLAVLKDGIVNIAEGVLALTSGAGALVRFGNETLNILEDLVKARGQVRAIDEDEEINEAPLVVRALVRFRDETVSIAEDVINHIGLTRLRDETLNITEGAVLNIIGIVRLLNERLFVQEADDSTFANLEAHIKGDDNVIDSSGNGNNGTWTGTPAFVDGKIGRAMDFDGTNRVELDNEANFDYDRTDPFSISFWLKAPVGRGSFETLIANNTNINGKGYSVYLQTDDRVIFQIHDGTDFYHVDTSGLTQDAELHHYLLTFSGNSNESGMSLYKDGLLIDVGFDDDIAADILNDTALTLGANQGGARQIVAELDNVQIYNRELTAVEAKELGQPTISLVEQRRFANETEEISEDPLVVRALVRFRDEVVNILEAIVTVRELVRFRDETVSIAEDVIEVLSGGLIKFANETVNILEGILSVRGLVRFRPETLNITESPLERPERIRATDETEEISEPTPLGLKGIVRAVNETVNIIEDGLAVLRAEFIDIAENLVALVQTAGPVKFANETVNIVEDFVTKLGIIKLANETVNILEDLVSVRTLIRFRNETVNILEGLVKVRVQVRAVDETEDITENNIAVRGLVRFRNETVNILEGIIASTGFSKIVDETVNILEATNRSLALGITKVIDETVNITEGVLNLLGLHRFRNETLNITEAPLVVRGLTQIKNETLNILEVIVEKTQFVKLVNELERVVENLLRPRTLVRFAEREVNENHDFTVSSGQSSSAITTTGHMGMRFTFDKPTKITSFRMNSGEFIDFVQIEEMKAEIRTGISIGSSSDGTLHKTSDNTEPTPQPSTAVRVFTFTDAPFLTGEVYIVVKYNVSVGNVFFVLNPSQFGFPAVWTSNSSSNWQSHGPPQAYYQGFKGIEQGEGIEITEGILERLGFVKVADETLNILEGIINHIGLTRRANEVVSILEGLVNQNVVVRVRNETLNILEAVNRSTVSFVTELKNEIVNIGEVVVQKVTTIKITNETVNLTEGLVKIIGLIKQFINETLNISEPIVGLLQHLRSINETVFIGDVQNRVRAFFVVFNENLNILEDLIRARVLIRFANTLELDNLAIPFDIGSGADPIRRGQRITLGARKVVDIIVVYKAIGLPPTGGTVQGKIWKDATAGGSSETLVASSVETFNVVDLVTNQEITFTFNAIVENVELVIGAEFTGHDQLVGIAPNNGPITGEVTAREGAGNWINVPSQDLACQLTTSGETVDIPEAVNEATGIIQVRDEVVQIAEDIVSGILGLVRSVNESLNIIEEAFALRERVIESIIEIGEAVNRVIGFNRIKNETEEIVEQVFGKRPLRVFANEVVNVLENLVKVRGQVRFANEVVSVVEAVITFLVPPTVKIVNEVMNIPEGIIRARGQLRIINENLSIDEFLLPVKRVLKSVDETLNITEAKNFARGAVRQISETVNITEARNRIITVVRQVSETLNITEARNKTSGFVRLIAETLTIPETVAFRIPFRVIRVINESVQILEGLSIIKPLLLRIVTRLNLISNAITKLLLVPNVINRLNLVQNLVTTVNLVSNSTTRVNLISNDTTKIEMERVP